MNVLKLTIAAIIAGVFLAVGAMFLLPLKDHSEYVRQYDPSSVSVLVLGDYGTGDYRQRRVAVLMERACRELSGNLLVQTLGDNFYPDGVTGVDDPLWQSVFEAVYDTPCLRQTPFYAALGNHDYTLDPYAQVAYGRLGLGSGQWRMPGPYYVHAHGTLNDAPLVTIAVLDTNQPLDDQLTMMQDAFANDDTGWRVVAAHNNIRTRSLKYHDDDRFQQGLLPALKALRVDLYLSGHSHNLQLIEVEGEPLYIIGGAGGKNPREMIAGNADTDHFLGLELGFSTLTFTPDQLTIGFTQTSPVFLSTLQARTTTFVMARRCEGASQSVDCPDRIRKLPAE